MREETIKVFKFNELSDQAKETAREWYREGALDYDWWEYTYEAFDTLCEMMGVTISRKEKRKSEPEIWFRGFYSQGDGSSFDAIVDLPKLIVAIRNEEWKKEFPTLELRFEKEPKHTRRILKLIDHGLLDVSISIRPTNRESSVRVNVDWDYGYGECTNYKNLESVMSDLDSFLEDVAETLNSHVYRSLEKEYEYLMSDEAVDESIISNEYEFTEHGERWA